MDTKNEKSNQIATLFSIFRQILLKILQIFTKMTKIIVIFS